MEFQPMSPEEIERTVQFLLHQQAQFAADFATLSGKTDHLADGLIGLTSIVGRLADGLGQLTAAQQRTDQQLRETDSHLSAVIRMFEQHVREDHGHPPS
jgi:ABC-type transporter Mla subunit MlaD